MVPCVPFPFSPLSLFFGLPLWRVGLAVLLRWCSGFRVGAFFQPFVRGALCAALGRARVCLRFLVGLFGACVPVRPAGWRAVFPAGFGAWFALAGVRAGGLGGVLVFGPGSVLALGGSRSLSALPAGVLPALVASGASFRVGCCVGFDALAVSFLQSAAPGRLAVCAAFGPGGVGSCSLSAVSVVSSAGRAGVPVSFWAGGGPAVPLVGRLAQRSAAVVRGASALSLIHI